MFSDEIYARLVYDGQSTAPSYLKAAETAGVLDRVRGMYHAMPFVINTLDVV